MELVEFIRLHGLPALEERFAICVRRHGALPNLVLLKYHQINSPMGERVVQQCRGIILDEADDWRVVCRPYDKFFNYGEPNAATIDWTTARVYEKLDGSLMTVYWYGGQWRISSSGMPDAAGQVNTSGETFASLFWRTWEALSYAMPEDRDACYMFELMTPANQVIVRHAQPRIVLHGVRRTDGVELEPEAVAARYGWACVGSYSLGTVEEVIGACAGMNPLEAEGYVVRDGAFRRVKVKSPRYVALAHLKESVTPRRLLEIARANEGDELVAYLPEVKAEFDKVAAAYAALCGEAEGCYEKLRSIEGQREFAAAASKLRCAAALFALRSGKARTAREFFAGVTIQALMRTMGWRESDEAASEAAGG